MKKSTKTNLSATLLIGAVIILLFSIFWALISYINFLVKDITFNVASLWVMAGSFLLSIAGVLFVHKYGKGKK